MRFLNIQFPANSWVAVLTGFKVKEDAVTRYYEGHAIWDVPAQINEYILDNHRIGQPIGSYWEDVFISL